MAKEVVKEFFVSAPAERVLEGLCAERYNLEAERRRREVIATEYVLVERSDDRIVFEVRTEEPDRKKTGALDRKHPVHSVTRYVWDAGDETLRWAYEGIGKGLIDVTGSYRLRSRERGTHITHTVGIDVHVPIVGGAVAMVLGREFDKVCPAQQQLLRRELGLEGDVCEAMPG
jgi:uncharacterized protein DUF2505